MKCLQNQKAQVLQTKTNLELETNVSHISYISQLEDLQDKENQLAVLSEEKDRNLKQHAQYFDKIRKDIDTTRKQLHHERNLKLDAFQRVDDLQAVVTLNDYSFNKRNRKPLFYLSFSHFNSLFLCT